MIGGRYCNDKLFFLLYLYPYLLCKVVFFHSRYIIIRPLIIYALTDISFIFAVQVVIGLALALLF